MYIRLFVQGGYSGNEELRELWNIRQQNTEDTASKLDGDFELPKDNKQTTSIIASISYEINLLTYLQKWLTMV